MVDRSVCVCQVFRANWTVLPVQVKPGETVQKTKCMGPFKLWKVKKKTIACGIAAAGSAKTLSTPRRFKSEFVWFLSSILNASKKDGFRPHGWLASLHAKKKKGTSFMIFKQVTGKISAEGVIEAFLGHPFCYTEYVREW